MASEPRTERTRWRLEDMLEYAREALAIAGGKTPAELEVDRKSQLAAIRCLEILGEAANRIPAAVQAAFPSIPWKGIISTRHRLIHGYDSVSLDVVAAILDRELPDLIPKLEAILQQLPGD